MIETSKSEKTGLSFIICCFNSENRVKSAIQSIFNQINSINLPMEIIVVDNNSSDYTFDVASALGVHSPLPLRVVRETKQGLMNARIKGVVSSIYSLLCFVDDDNILADNYSDIAFDIFSNDNDIGYAGGQTALPSKYINLPKWFKNMSGAYAVGDQYQTSRFVSNENPTLWGAGLIIRRNPLYLVIESQYTFRLMGRNGAFQLAGDDSEICFVLCCLGWKGYYCQKLKLIHSIDVDRLTEERLLSMFSGFGKSASILNIYQSISSKNTSLSLKMKFEKAIKEHYFSYYIFAIFNYIISMLKAIIYKNENKITFLCKSEFYLNLAKNLSKHPKKERASIILSLSKIRSIDGRNRSR